MLAQKVRDVMSVSVGVAWDDCHKVYILGDWQQVDNMRDLGYETLVTTDDYNREELVIKTLEFFHDSCNLRFITHLVTTEEGELFNSVINQFEKVG